MIFFPIRTDRRQVSTPWVNYLLLLSNVVIFILTRNHIHTVSVLMMRGYSREAIAERFPVIDYYLWPNDPTLVQFFTTQFLHGDWMHLIGNMIFLWVFGNALEDRMGKVGYLAFYLAGGIGAGLGHAMLYENPVIGASGAIAAVTGAYLVLFPLVKVTIFYWFYFYVGAFAVSSMVLIIFQIAQNILFECMGMPGVAYLAHLSGYAYGFAVGMGLLTLRLLPREPYDLLSMMAHRRRRRQFQSMTRQGYRPWDHHRPDDAATGRPTEISAEQQQIMQARARVYEALNQHDLPRAAAYYSQLLDLDDKQTLSQQHQLDIANHLMSEQRHQRAAQAYELFLSVYRSYPQREQIELILALIYARYLDNPARARELLESALPRLRDPEQRRLAEQVLAGVR